MPGRGGWNAEGSVLTWSGRMLCGWTGVCPGRVRGDVVLLDYANHTMDVEMNTDDGIDGEWKAERHLRSLHAARKGYVPISPDGYLQELASAYMARACPYRAGFQRICNADARALLNEEVLPVFQLNRPDYGRLLCTDELKRMGRDEVFRYPDGRQQRLCTAGKESRWSNTVTWCKRHGTVRRQDDAV